MIVVLGEVRVRRSSRLRNTVLVPAGLGLGAANGGGCTGEMDGTVLTRSMVSSHQGQQLKSHHCTEMESLEQTGYDPVMTCDIWCVR